MITKFKQKISLLLCCQLNFISLAVAAQNENAILFQYRNANIYYYKNVAISYVDGDDNSHDSFETKAGRKIVIQPITLKSNSTINAKEPMGASKVSELGKPIWAITIEQLPISEDHCLMSEIDCRDDSPYCYKPCFFATSPEILAFDESRGKLYLAMPASNFGTAGGTYFTFVADINKKEIKYLHDEFGPLKGSLSPSGKYLLINNKVYNTQTDEYFMISKKTIYDPPEKRQFHYINQIKWLNDTQFTYQDSVAHDKFQNGVDSITEHTVDIPTKKTVYSKTIKANTYQYKPGDELRN